MKAKGCQEKIWKNCWKVWKIPKGNGNLEKYWLVLKTFWKFSTEAVKSPDKLYSFHIGQNNKI
jgi:hypothetical protein